MPHLRFHGVRPADVQHLSQDLAQELAKLYETSPDNFTLEHVPTQFFTNGAQAGAYPFVEVHMFARGPEQKQKGAEYLTRRLQKLTGAQDVCVLYRILEKENYFENGKHF